MYRYGCAYQALVIFHNKNSMPGFGRFWTPLSDLSEKVVIRNHLRVPEVINSFTCLFLKCGKKKNADKTRTSLLDPRKVAGLPPLPPFNTAGPTVKSVGKVF